jgi:hypothetical protein
VNKPSDLLPDDQGHVDPNRFVDYILVKQHLPISTRHLRRLAASGQIDWVLLDQRRRLVVDWPAAQKWWARERAINIDDSLRESLRLGRARRPLARLLNYEQTN